MQQDVHLKGIKPRQCVENVSGLVRLKESPRKLCLPWGFFLIQNGLYYLLLSIVYRC